MEVLKEGNDLKWMRKIVCPDCLSELIITADDIKYKFEEYYIICNENKPDQHYLCLMKYNMGTMQKKLIDIPEHVKSAAKHRWGEAESKKRNQELREDINKTTSDITNFERNYIYKPLAYLLLILTIIVILHFSGVFK